MVGTVPSVDPTAATDGPGATEPGGAVADASAEVSGPAVLLCTDGSDLSIAALAAGLELIGPKHLPTVVTVVEEPDPTLVTGTGIAGGVMSPEEFDRSVAATQEEGAVTIARVQQQLGLDGGPGQVLEGHVGTAICDYADQIGAVAIVIGTRGRGGFKRAVLGSVSDHIVRNAPCPVVVTGQGGFDDE
jgi:nucleotide-binding universal stress UspA family protein